MFTLHQTAAELSASSCGTAVLPIGAVEQHGRHLPVGTDVLLAQAFAERIAERTAGYLLPPLAISSSIEHRGTKGINRCKSSCIISVCQYNRRRCL